MTLLEEYENQSLWRDWGRYLDRLPLTCGQTVYDLGCSFGAVTGLLAQRVRKAVGVDSDTVLIEEAKRQKHPNSDFVLADLQTANPSDFEKCDGIWLSFTLAYIHDPAAFISQWAQCLKPGGWFAVADIDGLFSCHLTKAHPYFKEIEAFEMTSGESGAYDFRIGRKIRGLLAQSGLDIIVEEDNWYDRELNFQGPAAPEIARNWEARLARMVSLKAFFGTRYDDFCRAFMNAILDNQHVCNGGVRFIVGRRP